MKVKEDNVMYIYEIIGNNIKKYRKLKGWTQDKLAEETGFSSETIRSAESRTRKSFSIGTLYIIARALNVETYKLFIDTTKVIENKSIDFICDKCNYKTEIPSDIVDTYKFLSNKFGNSNIPTIKCPKCDEGTLKPKNYMDL